MDDKANNKNDDADRYFEAHFEDRGNASDPEPRKRIGCFSLLIGVVAFSVMFNWLSGFFEDDTALEPGEPVAVVQAECNCLPGGYMPFEDVEKGEISYEEYEQLLENGVEPCLWAERDDALDGKYAAEFIPKGELVTKNNMIESHIEEPESPWMEGVSPSEIFKLDIPEDYKNDPRLAYGALVKMTLTYMYGDDVNAPIRTETREGIGTLCDLYNKNHNSLYHYFHKYIQIPSKYRVPYFRECYEDDSLFFEYITPDVLVFKMPAEDAARLSKDAAKISRVEFEILEQRDVRTEECEVFADQFALLTDSLIKASEIIDQTEEE